MSTRMAIPKLDVMRIQCLSSPTSLATTPINIGRGTKRKRFCKTFCEVIAIFSQVFWMFSQSFRNCWTCSDFVAHVLTRSEKVVCLRGIDSKISFSITFDRFRFNFVVLSFEFTCGTSSANSENHGDLCSDM